MSDAVREVALVILGFALGLIPIYWQRRGRVRAHWSALAAEAGFCERLARTYLTAGVDAPLYRLPDAAFATAFPALLADAGLLEHEVTELEEFWGWVQDINRGLDNANTALNQNDSARLATEANRLRLKCSDLLEAQAGSEARIAIVRRILARHAA